MLCGGWRGNREHKAADHQSVRKQKTPGDEWPIEPKSLDIMGAMGRSSTTPNPSPLSHYTGLPVGQNVNPAWPNPSSLPSKS